MKKKMNNKRESVGTLTGIRIPDPLIARLEKLADRMSEPGIRHTRADVMRKALYKGIDILEAEEKTAK